MHFYKCDGDIAEIVKTTNQMKKHLILALFACLFATASTWAQSRSTQEMSNKAQEVLSAIGVNTNAQARVLYTASSFSVYGYINGGFVIIAKQGLGDGIVGYSPNIFPEKPRGAFKQYLDGVNSTLSSQTTRSSLPSNLNGTSVAPLCRTAWGTREPFNQQSPMKTANGAQVHADAGSAAIALAQLGYFWRNSIKNTQTYARNAPWDKLASQYSAGQFTTAQANSMASMVGVLGKAVSTTYEPEASSATLESVGKALPETLGFQSDYRLWNRNGVSPNKWMYVIYDNLSQQLPVLYCLKEDKSFGLNLLGNNHYFLIDGYDRQGLVHVNWCDGGVANGNFDFSFLDSEQRMFTNIHPADIKLRTTDVKVAKAGQLSKQINKEQLGLTSRLKVTGQLNASDLAQLRSVAEVLNGQSNPDGLLSYLDLSEATIAGNEIPEKAFSGCGFSYLAIPNSIRFIRANAFENGIVEDFHYGKAIETIDNEAFLDFTGLSTFMVYPALQSLSPIAFLGCDMEKFEQEGTNTQFSVVNGVLFSADQTTLFMFPFRKSGKYTIPNTVTTIADYALALSHITKLTVPSTVRQTGENNLYNNETLQEVTLQEGFIAIADNFFSGCTDLREVNLPKTLQKIGNNCFVGCPKLKEVELHASIQEIGGGSFSNCAKLKELRVGSVNPPTVGAGAFTGSDVSKLKLYVPKGTLATYKNAPFWSGFKSIKEKNLK